MRTICGCWQNAGRRGRATVFMSGFVALLLLDPGRGRAQSGGLPPDLSDWRDAEVGETSLLPSGIARSLIDDSRKLEPIKPGAKWKAFQLKGERGIELVSLYRKAAPSVVLIIAGGEMGSGFVINKAGWLISNHHVARGGILQDDLTRQVTIVFGSLNDQGSMEPLEGRYKAQVYKWDKVRDLALLKLTEMPSWAAQTGLPVIQISEKSISPGDDVAAIGNAGMSLLWSLKPGVVQGVGRKLADQAMDFARHELRAEQVNKVVTDSASAEVERELEQAVEPMRNVMVVQATCPIMHGDSGGPLLDLADGRAVGINDYVAPDNSGTAHFFVHAIEMRGFLKDAPDTPLRVPPSIWDVQATACAIQRGTNGKPEVMILSRVVATPSGHITNILAKGWDLTGQSDLTSFVRRTPDGRSLLNANAVFLTKTMRFQVCVVADNQTQVWAYDLDHNGYFGLVRLGPIKTGLCESELWSDGPGKSYQARRLTGRQGVVLDAERIPEPWRAKYEDVVLKPLRARKAAAGTP